MFKCFDFVKCLVIFSQSHVHKLVIFLEFTLLDLIFSCFYSGAALIDILHVFFHPLIFIFIPNSHIKFPCQSTLERLKFQCYRVYF